MRQTWLTCAAAMVGMTPALGADDASGNASGDIRLAQQAHHHTHAGEVEELLVTGSPLGRSSEELAQPTQVLHGNDLLRNLGINIGETLAQQPGVSSTFFGAGASRPIIRGQRGPRVRVLEDSIGTLDASTTSDDHAVTVEPLIADQVEIFRGPSTLLFGSGAGGGAVNVVTNRVPRFVPESAIEGSAEVRGDSVADETTGVLRLDGGAGHFAFHLDALSRETEDYEIPEFANEPPEPGEEPGGKLPNSDTETDSGAFGVSYVADTGFSGIAVSRLETEYGLPGEEDESEGGPVRIDLEQTRLDLAGSWEEPFTGVDIVRFRLAYNDYEHTELEGGEQGTVFENEAVEGRVEFAHSPWGDWEGAFGLQFGDREFSAIGEEAFVPPVDTGAVGLFGVEERQFENWIVQLGARVEYQEHSPSNDLPDNDDVGLSFSFGAMHEFQRDYALSLNLSAGERGPSVEELYSDGPHLATGTFEIGDPELDNETAVNVDVTLEKVAGGVTFAVTWFYNDISDYIFLRNTGMTDAGEGLPVFEYKQADARLTGYEAEITVPLVSREDSFGDLDLVFLSDVVDGELTTDNSTLPRIPPWRVGMGLRYERRNIAAGIDVMEYDEQTDVAEFESETAGYTMLNADFSVDIPIEPVAFQFFVQGRNLLDEDARKHTSFVKDRAPLPGRNVIAGVRAMF